MLFFIYGNGNPCWEASTDEVRHRIVQDRPYSFEFFIFIECRRGRQTTASPGPMGRNGNFFPSN